ncbi:cyclic nucleotide-binding domain-containing protein [Roseovarius sp.]|nr:cyclic nucleotide-binding domain-containing protein [Roseovarius sp.]
MDAAYLNWFELVGYLACGLVFLTFSMKRMLQLRLIAIASNIAFLVYGAGAGLIPIFILHATLLPLNVYRTVQKVRELKSLKKALEGRAEIDVLMPFMTRRRLPKDTVLFRKGEVAEAIYFLANGKLLIPELEKTVLPGTLVGEIGIFRPDKKRTASMLCKTDCELYAISENDVHQQCLENPQFGLFLTKLIASRLFDESPPAPDLHLRTTGT